jgi:hypothetical protein
MLRFLLCLLLGGLLHWTLNLGANLLSAVVTVHLGVWGGLGLGLGLGFGLRIVSELGDMG